MGLSDRFLQSNDRAGRVNDQIAGKRMQESRMRRDYFESVPWTIAMSGCCEIVRFGCMSVSIAMWMLTHLLVCGRRNWNRFETWLMNYYCMCLCCCHCMESVDSIRTAQAKMVELHLAMPRRMQNILFAE